MKLLAAFLIAVMLFTGQAAAPARAEICGKTYTIRLGDTLYGIAKRCNVSYLVLMSINFEISDPSRIYPGQVIRLEAEAPIDQYRKPASGPADTAGYQPGGAYIVRKGDSLARIAYLYSTTVQQMIDYNPILRQNAVIVPGQVLLLPPEAAHGKGWVGVSRVRAESGDQIEARVIDFPAYAFLELTLVIPDEEDYVYGRIQIKTDARGEGRGTLVIPWYAFEGEVFQIHAVNLDDADQPVVKSPEITVID